MDVIRAERSGTALTQTGDANNNVMSAVVSDEGSGLSACDRHLLENAGSDRIHHTLALERALLKDQQAAATKFYDEAQAAARASFMTTLADARAAFDHREALLWRVYAAKVQKEDEAWEEDEVWQACLRFLDASSDEELSL